MQKYAIRESENAVGDTIFRVYMQDESGAIVMAMAAAYDTREQLMESFKEFQEDLLWKDAEFQEVSYPGHKFKLTGREHESDIQLAFPEEVYYSSPKFDFYYDRIKALLTMKECQIIGFSLSNDHSLHALNLPDPDKLIKDFWDIVNNPEKVSVNILTDKHVQKQGIDGKHIVVITVPKAERSDKPVYIGGNPFSGSYRRNGEGDYKCTKEEIQAMLRDASIKTQDMLILENMGLEVLDYDSLHRYRIRMKNYRPGHVWEELDDEEFLYRLGAAGRSEDGKIHPTAAGLLMFGHEYEVVKEYPYYFLDYQERMDDGRWTDRIVSTSGDWSGNVYDFYFRVYNKLTQDIKVPFKLEGGDRIDDTPVHKALREALANCLINADYYGRQGLVVIKDRKGVTFSNPGNFRIDVEVAKSGGVSDPRNGALIKMFNLVDIGERAGSGIPNIFSVWKKQGWVAPEITETFEPERITVRLLMTDDKPTINTDDKCC